MPHNSNQMIRTYLDVKQRVIDAGFATEIDWQEQQRIDHVVESELLREVAWVILSCGMRESVIRRLFDSFSRAFLNWRSADSIWSRRENCKIQAIKIFGHKGKIAAILEFTAYVSRRGFPFTVSMIKEGGEEFLRRFAYLGPATSLHLAKNLGVDVVKPDRHLRRIAMAWGAESPRALCENIARAVGDRTNVVDLVLWRFATIQRNYVATFARARKK